MFLTLALALSACSAGDPQSAETTDQVTESLCASYPVSGNGDGNGSGTPTAPLTGYVTKLRVNATYATRIDVTFKNATTGVETTQAINFGALPGGPANISFAGPGWTGSVSAPITRINICNPNSNQPAFCGGNSCMQGANIQCMFVNNQLAFTWNWTNGTIVPSSNNPSFPGGVSGIWGTAPNEPSHFRIFNNNGAGASKSSRWTLLNGTTCP